MEINGYQTGPRANLRGADLRDADLRRANLRGADLYGADLYGTDLYGADLRDADLRGVDLYGANLRDANLRGANLRGANLRDANWHGVNLRGANLRGATLDPLLAASLSIVPEVGAFIGWKKCRGNVIVKVRIPAAAKRSNATGRKCRAEFVKVLAVFDDDYAVSIHNAAIVYIKGETVRCDTWCEDRFEECAGGIHFYITRAEAEAH